MRGPACLVTLPVSHFCEKARWALTFFGIDFQEDAHAPPFHRGASKGNSVPILLDETGSLVVGSDAIVEWAKNRATKNIGAAKIPAASDEWLKDMDLLGVRVRQWAYFYILQDWPLALDQLAPVGSVPASERWWLSWSMWALAPLMKMGMEISESSAAEALRFVESVFEKVEKELEKSAFLSGSEFGCRDINFCSLAAPIVLPPQMPLYGALFDRLDDDSTIKVMIRRFRSRPGGKFVLKCYEKHRK